MNRFGTWAVAAACLILIGCAPIESEVESVQPTPDSVTSTVEFDIVVDFDHSMKAESITTDTFLVTGSESGAHLGAYVLSAGDTRVTFTTTTGFIAGETVIVDLTSSIESQSDKALDAYSWSFTVAPVTPVEPSPLFITSTTPPIESPSGILNGNFAVAFNGPIDPSSLVDGVVRIEGSRSGQREIHFDSIVTSLPVPLLPFTVDRPFLAGERVTLSVGAELLGLAGDMALPSVVQFTGRQQGTGLGEYDLAGGTGLVGGRVHFLDLDHDGRDEWAIVEADGTILVEEENAGLVDLVGNWKIGGSVADSAVGDFNGDGRIDLATLSATGTSVSLLLGSPSNALPFEAPLEVLLDLPADSIVAGHLNSDGITDLLLVDSFGMSVAAGHVDSPLAAQLALPEVAPVGPPAIGDFDGDGLNDVALALASGDLQILIGHDDGTFGAAVTLTPVSPATGVVAVNLDGDSVIDLVATAAAGELGTAFVPVGAMGFDDLALFADAAGTGAIAVDWNGDGDADLVTPIPGTSDLRVALGTGNGNLAQPTVQTAPAEIAGLSLGDTDGDAILDFAIVHPDGAWGIGHGSTGNPTLADRVRVITVDPSVADQGNPTLEVTAGDTDVPFHVLVDCERDLQGLTLVLDYDPTLLAVTAWTADGTDVGNLAPDFVQAQNNDVSGALILGVIFQFLPSNPPVLLPVGTGHVAATGLFDVAIDAPTALTQIGPKDGLGSPPADNSFVSDGLSYAPELVSADISITEDPTGNTDPLFLRGDANGDGSVNVADSTFLQDYVTGASGVAPPCFDAADANDDGTINIADVTYINAYLFSGGPQPPAPFPQSGSDPTTDSLDCSP